MPTPPVVAFFDVDNTLVRGSSMVLFASGLVRHRYVTLRKFLPSLVKHLKFRAFGWEFAGDRADGSAEALDFFAGRSYAELVDLARRIVSESISRKLWAGTVDIIRTHLEAGHEVWLVTATPVELAQALADHLGATGALGTVSGVADGVLTGQLVGEILHGPGKRLAALELAETKGFDLAESFAYSDSVNDLPLLSIVGHPVAINPHPRLRARARWLGWPVHDFRRVRRVVVSRWGAALGIVALVHLCNLIEGELHRGIAAEDGHQGM